MAITLPGISYLRGYDKPDIVGEFARGYQFGGGIADERDAKDALTKYVESLFGPQPAATQQQMAPSPRAVSAFAPGQDSGTRLINDSTAAATAATDPRLSAALERKMPSSTAPAGPDGAARQAMQFFVGKGYTPAQAAGIVGNLMHESGLNTGATNPGDGADGSNSIGVAQWNADRAKGLQTFAQQMGGNPNDLMTQLAYVEHELQGPESRTREALLAAQDPIAATKAFVGYERPQGWTPETPTAALGFGSRAKNAASLMGGDYQMAPQDPSSPSGAPIGSTASTAGLPDRETMLALFRNPTTRGFAQELVTAAQAGQAPPKPSGEMVKFLEAQANPAFAQFLRDNKDGTSVVVNNGGADDEFYKAGSKARGEQFAGIETAGYQAGAKLGQINRLEQLLESAPQGMEGAWKQFAGQFGVDSEGLDDIQAAQALLNKMVPEQRTPGSGPMSDADLALFKESMPRIVNQPGGNALIIQTLKGIALYEQEMGEIAGRVLNKEITPAQGRAEMAKVANPLDAFRTASQRGADDVPEGVPADVWAVMTPEERALWQ